MTSIGSGLGASFGTAIEPAYGTLAAPTKFHALDSSEMKLSPVWDKGNGLWGGLGHQDPAVVLTNADAGGTIKTNIYYAGALRFLASVMGCLGTAGALQPVQNGATTAYTTTMPLSPSVLQSFTLQEGIPDVGGNVHFWNSVGCKVTQAQFDCAAGQGLRASYSVDAQDRYETGTGTAATPPAPQPFFTWRDMTVKLGAFGSEVKVDGTSKWTGTIKRTLSTKRFNAGNLTQNPNLSYAVKSEPTDNGFAEVSGTLETEYLNDSLYENYFTTNTPFSLVVGFSSIALAGVGFPFSLSFAFPRCRFLTGDQPSVKGPDLIKPVMAWEAFSDGTHPQATVTVVSQETAL